MGEDEWEIPEDPEDRGEALLRYVRADRSVAGLDFSGAYLHEANLYRANLHEANLYRANLSGANLNSADLREADLREADLSGADLHGAKLREANLIKADLSREQSEGGKSICLPILLDDVLDGAQPPPGWPDHLTESFHMLKSRVCADFRGVQPGTERWNEQIGRILKALKKRDDVEP